MKRDLLYAYQGLKDTTKDAEPLEEHLPASINQGASNLHSDEDMEDKIKLLDPRVQKLIKTYLEVSTRRPSQRWQASPRGDGPPPPPRHAAPTGHAGQGDSVAPPHPHTRAHSTWVADPNSPPSGRAVGGGTAPDLRRPSQW